MSHFTIRHVLTNILMLINETELLSNLNGRINLHC